MLRDLLVHVDGSEAGRRRVGYAVNLAEKLGARLTGIHITPPAEAPPLYKPGVLPRAEQAIAERLAFDGNAAATIFAEETASLPEAPWSQGTGDVAGGVCARARYADMVLIGQYEWQDPPQRHPLPISSSIVSHCGRPVLVVPSETGATELANVAIAWDGSREAVRAVHDGLSLMRLARAVEILTIIGPDAIYDEAEAKALAAHLSRHGITVGAGVRKIRTPDEHGALRRQIAQGAYDLLVMGGYSHPMWMELALGGVTQSTLLTSKTPILVSH